MLKNLSRKFGIAGSVITILPCIILLADYVNVINSSEPSVNNEGAGLAGALLLMCVGPALLFSIVGLVGSLLVHKDPLAGAVLMLVSGGLILFFGLILWWPCIPALLFIAAGVLAIVGIRKDSVNIEPQNAGKAI